MVRTYDLAAAGSRRIGSGRPPRRIASASSLGCPPASLSMSAGNSAAARGCPSGAHQDADRRGFRPGCTGRTAMPPKPASARAPRPARRRARSASTCRARMSRRRRIDPCGERAGAAHARGGAPGRARHSARRIVERRVHQHPSPPGRARPRERVPRAATSSVTTATRAASRLRAAFSRASAASAGSISTSLTVEPGTRARARGRRRRPRRRVRPRCSPGARTTAAASRIASWPKRWPRRGWRSTSRPPRTASSVVSDVSRHRDAARGRARHR